LPAVTTLFIGISLYQSTLLRRTGLIIAILSGILIPLSVVVGYPPFVFGFLWLAIGIGLLSRK
jgi:zinc transporter ZupT